MVALDLSHPFEHLHKCKVCLKTFKLTYASIDLISWKNGMPIQIAFPNLNPSEYELIKSGICKECFDQTLSFCIRVNNWKWFPN